MDRAAWLKERRAMIEQRMDTLWAPIYDDDWGSYINPSHERMIARFLALCPPGAQVLDVACGTGKYWPLLFAHGCTVAGTDQSAGMLAQAAKKFPPVPLRHLGMQELADEAAFDGLICMDAMEFVFPEDWPGVLANFHRALKPGGPLYFTVEIPEDRLAEVNQAARAAGFPVVAGEWLENGGYHYYPAMEQVRRWTVAAGFDLLEEATGDDYQHFLTRKR